MQSSLLAQNFLKIPSPESPEVTFVWCVAVLFLFQSTASGMLPLIPCHHFTTQHVLSIEDEPLAISGAGNALYVATSRCFVDRYILTKNASTQCQFVGSFPSVAAVDQMAYSEKGM